MCSVCVGDVICWCGVLLVVFNWVNCIWNFWSSEMLDVSFVKVVLEDVVGYYLIDCDWIFVFGYFFGSVMVWWYVCDCGNEVVVLIVVVGSLC